MSIRHIKHPFPAVIDGESRILILGSVPSVKSVENNFYYMHPKNRFWKVLSCLYDVDLYSMSVEERIGFLHKHHIALYDSVEECDIEASKDSAISNVTPADIPSLIAKSKISRIYCNGKASYRYLLSAYPEYEKMTVLLPSTSPANALYSLEKLVCEWKIVANDKND